MSNFGFHTNSNFYLYHEMKNGRQPRYRLSDTYDTKKRSRHSRETGYFPNTHRDQKLPELKLETQNSNIFETKNNSP